jgi:ATP-dependent Clp protease adaptor protein ClpS
MPMARGPKAGGDSLVATSTDKKTRTAPPRMYRVLLHNDDFTTMDFVVSVLQRIFGKSEAEAVRLTMVVHTEGACVAGIYPFSIAETKAAQVMQEAAEAEFPFLSTVEPADEEP